MYYVVRDISTSKVSGETFIIVEYWWEKKDFDLLRPPYLVNDFDLQLREDGKGVSAISEEIHAIVKKYWSTAIANGWRGDHTLDATKQFFRYDKPVDQGNSKPPLKDKSDPNGILARDDVKDMEGTGYEELGVVQP